MKDFLQTIILTLATKFEKSIAISETLIMWLSVTEYFTITEFFFIRSW